MTVRIQITTAQCDDREIYSRLISYLTNQGYRPLITEAKQRFLSVFDENGQIPLSSNLITKSFSVLGARLKPWGLQKYPRNVIETLGEISEGEIFFSVDKGLLFIYITLSYGENDEYVSPPKLTVGHIGEEGTEENLEKFLNVINKFLSEENRNLY